MQTRTLIGIGLAALSGIGFGAGGIAAQYLFTYCRFTPLDLVSVRLFGAGLILLLAYGIATRRNFFRDIFRNLRNIGAILVFGVGLLLLQLTFFVSIDKSNAGTASLMVGFVPLMILFWLAVREKRPVTGTEYVCLALAVTGVVLLVTRGDFTSLNFTVAGVVWGLISAGFQAFCTLQPKKVTGRIGVVPVLGCGLLVGGLLGFIVQPPFHMDVDWTPAAFANYLFIVLVASVLAYYSLLKSMEYVSASVTGLLSSFEPLTAVVLTVIVFHVPFNAWEITGAACVILNMVLLALQDRKKEK